MFDVVGVGHSCVDRLCMVEDYPREDESTHITSISVQGGGAVATAMVAVARLGKRSAFIGNIGPDMISTEAKRLFESDGVDTSNMVEREDCWGLESFVMVNPENGSRTKFPQRDKNPPIEWNDSLKEVIRSAKFLHLDGTNYQNAISAAKIAKELGVTISLDGCSMQKDNSLNRDLASLADILIMNKKYPLRVSGKDTYEEALLEMSTWGPKTVMCTLGDKGVLAVIDGKVKSFPAYSVKALDTTGCGDVFHGSYLVALLDGLDTEDAIRFASAVSAIKAQRVGGRAGIPTKEETLSFMKSV